MSVYFNSEIYLALRKLSSNPIHKQKTKTKTKQISMNHSTKSSSQIINTILKRENVIRIWIYLNVIFSTKSE